jgi:lysophospholipase L1-like esterase
LRPGLRRALSGWLGRLLLLCGSLAVAAAGFEAALRLAAGRDRGRRGDERQTYMQPDPWLGWSKRPGARVTYVRPEYTVEVAINGHGLRDRERAYGRVPGTFRVLALGDSFIEAYSVPFEASVTALLEGALAGDGCPAEVINAGTSGYSTDQEYLYYTREGVRYAPDVVVVFFHYNDLLHNVYERYYRQPKPRLEVADGEVRLANYPVPPPPPAAPAGPPRPRKGSLAWYWVRERLMLGAPRAFDLLARTGMWEPLGGDTPSDELGAFAKRRSWEMQYAWRVTDRILEALARQVESAGSRLVVAYVPARMEVSDRDWELSRLRYELREDRWDRRLVWNRLARSAESGGFPVLDLTDALRRADGRFRSTYYWRDGHWNERGHRVAAAELARWLRQEGWAPPCPGRR